MPQLPSGRHVGLHFWKLHAILEKPFEILNQGAILRIEHPDHVLQYGTVVFFRPASQAGEGYREEYSELGNTPEEPIEPYDSGFNLVTIQDELPHWSAADRDAFIDWLQASNARAYVQGQFEYVQSIRRQLPECGPFWSRVTALWWEAGVHPFQEEEAEPNRQVRERSN